MKKSIIFIALFAFVFSFTQIEAAKPVNPGNSSSAKLKTLSLVQLNELQVSAENIEISKANKKSLDKPLARTLKKGIRGNDVELLQTLLALDPTVYPEGMVTGYFGPLTQKAVTRFQAKYNLTADGIVGLKTKTVLENELDDADLDVEQTIENGQPAWKACGTIPPGHYLAQGWQKNKLTEALPPCSNLPLGIQMNLDKITEITEGEDEVVAIIENIAVENETNTTALISWRTKNEKTSSEIHYGTASGSYNIIFAEDLTLSNSHEMTLSGLNPNTTYYFVIKAIDKDGNEVVSPQNEFTTDDGSPDTKSPAISGLDVEESNTSTKISWKTDELSNGKVYLSTTSTFATATDTAENLSLDHSFTLENLEKNKTYYYKVESFDGAGNKDTETGTFTTLNEAEADNTDPAISGVFANVSGTSVTINWATNETTTGTLLYSLNKNYTDPVTVVVTPSGTSYTTTISGLDPDTKYYYKIEVKDLSDNTETYKGTFNIK